MMALCRGPRLPLTALLCMLLSCTFTFEEGQNQLAIRWLAGDGDSVSAMPRIGGVFTTPVVDSTVAFALSPPYPSLFVTINARRDTFAITTASMLNGFTRYVIRPARRIEAANGTSLGPADDSIVINTYGRENEPNDDAAQADTVHSRICATLSSANDTDWFVCPDREVSGIWIRSLDSPAFLAVLDSAQTIVAAGRRDVSCDTLIPPGLPHPFFAVVTPSQRVTAGNYELGVLYVKRQ